MVNGRRSSQDAAAERLRLVTDAARVTTLDAMDRNRVNEVLSAMVSTLKRYGKDEWADHVEVEDPNVEWKTLQGLLEDHGDGSLTERIEALYGRYERAFPSLLRLGFEVETEFDFVPGQYVTIRYQDVPRPYSLASSPSREEPEVCVRRVPEGHLTSELFTDLSPGDEVAVRGPNGDLLLSDPADTDMVFLATGTGVAPLKSMIDYTFEEGFDEFEGETRDVWLFLGAAWEDDLPYHEAFTDLDEERENFHYVPTLSREEYLSDWEGETAYVQRTLMKYMDDGALADADIGREMRRFADEEPNYDIDARLDPTEMEVYACGINAMVNGLVDAVVRAGVPEGSIESEGFG